MTLHIPEHVRSVIDPDGAVLLDVRRGKYFSLNGLAAEIWRRIEAGQQVSDIETELLQAYDVTPQVLHRDLLAFVERLTEGQLIDARD